jgi:hypothetical protein
LRSFLFRGGDPNVGRDGKFDYDGLVQSIQLAAERVRVALPSKFYLIDIKYSPSLCRVRAPYGDIHLITTHTYSLTNLEAGGDAPRTIAEWSFFNANPHLGKFIFWCVMDVRSIALRMPCVWRALTARRNRETHGTKDNASDPTVPAGLKQYMIEHFPVWQGDQLVTRMAELRTMLYTNCMLKSHTISANVLLVPQLLIANRAMPSRQLPCRSCCTDTATAVATGPARPWARTT